MLDRRPFIDAILEDPDDDTSRLVYADFLEEHGAEADCARAEFIRIGCEVAKLSPDSPRRAELERREDELLAAHGRSWCRDLPGEPDEWIRRRADGLRWRRGFPWRACLEGPDFLATLERILPGEALFGIELLGFTSPQEKFDPACAWLDRLVGNPLLRLVDFINLADSGLCLDPLVQPPGSRISKSQMPLYPRGAGHPERFVKLISSPHLSGLTEIAVDYDSIGLAGVRALLESPAPFRLRLLFLVGFISHHEVDDLEEEYLEAVWLLAESPRLAALESLGLGFNGTTRAILDETARILLASEHLPRSMKLNLGNPEPLSPQRRAELSERFHLHTWGEE
jgi:uncharacterized protein (TIGR02996 family)